MKNRAVEIFTSIPKTHNCAQSVAAGCERADLTAELQAAGGGRAPEGRCGALFAALLLTPAEKHAEIIAEFTACAGAETCREIKTVHHFPCAKCVELGAELVEKYAQE